MPYITGDLLLPYLLLFTTEIWINCSVRRIRKVELFRKDHIKSEKTSVASESSGGRWSSLFGYGRGTGGLPSGWERRNRRGEFLLCWLTRGYEEGRERRGGWGRKQVYE